VIKRTYFMRVKLYHNDGNGSLAWGHYVVTYRSFFPAPAKAFRECINAAKAEYLERYGTNENMEVISFNRI